MPRFADVTFPRRHPAADVAEHEVLMAFTGDAEALAFRAWWHEDGAALFAAWLARQPCAASPAVLPFAEAPARLGVWVPPVE